MWFYYYYCLYFDMEVLQYSCRQQSTLGLSDPSDVRTFEVILGVLLVNDFEVSPRFDLDPSDPPGANSDASDSQSIRALFALASMPSHSCVANATHDFSSRCST